MNWTYDLNVSAVHLRILPGKSSRQKVIGDESILDLDANGSVIGVEVLSHGGTMSASELLREGVPVNAIALLTRILVSNFPRLGSFTRDQDVSNEVETGQEQTVVFEPALS